MERLNSGEVVVGDGSFLITLEKRGYVKAGLWTPEAVIEHPNAGQCQHAQEHLGDILLTSDLENILKNQQHEFSNDYFTHKNCQDVETVTVHGLIEQKKMSLTTSSPIRHTHFHLYI